MANLHVQNVQQTRNVRMLMLCYHNTHGTNLMPCNLPPLQSPSCALALPAGSGAQLPLQREEEELDLGCIPHFLPPAAALPAFPQNTAEEQSHSRCEVSGNLWCLGKEHRKGGGFFFPVAEEMKKFSTVIFNCRFCC